jgi:hypothetical protein
MRVEQTKNRINYLAFFYIPTKYLLSTTSSLVLFPAKFMVNKPKASPDGTRRAIAEIDGAVDGDLNLE